MSKVNEIIWVTENYVDVDLPIIAELSLHYDILWIISHRQTSQFYSLCELQEIKQKMKLEVLIFTSKARLRNIRSLYHYFKIVKVIRKRKPKVIYLNILGLPYFYWLMLLWLPRKNIIYAAHDVIDHSGLRNRKLITWYKKIIFRYAKNFQFFSEYQEDKFRKLYKNKKYFTSKLYLKDYGEAKVEKTFNRTNFLFFGSIRDNKGLKYLIEVGNRLAEKYTSKFVITIAGECDNWSVYQEMITWPDHFKLFIKKIPNQDIPELFSAAHFVVLPYTDVTQSGVLMVAYNYNVPVIASEFREFRKHIIDEYTGYLFEPANVDNLYERMERALLLEPENYGGMVSSLKKYIEEEYSIKKITKDYKVFIDSLMLN